MQFIANRPSSLKETKVLLCWASCPLTKAGVLARSSLRETSGNLESSIKLESKTRWETGVEFNCVPYQ